MKPHSNQKPETRNTKQLRVKPHSNQKHETRNTKPETRNPKPETENFLIFKPHKTIQKMKKIKSLSLLIAALLVLTCCVKENHTVRFRNSFNKTINNVVAGTAQLGTVKPGNTSEYKAIETGNFSISGSTDSGEKLSGSGSLSGKGKHKWTITLSSAGTISMSEDK